MTMHRRFHTLDVFTDTPLAGNPLAVVLDSKDLDTSSMQRIAREFNLSETVFVMPPDDAKHRARIRIFTPVAELPFAGHPSVGSAVLLATLDHDGAAGSYLFGLEETIGIVSCAVTIAKSGRAFARFTLPRLPAELEEKRDTALVARALGLLPADIGFENHHVTVFSAGVPYTLVPVRDLRAIGRIAIETKAWREALGGGELAGPAYIYTRHTVDAASAFHARMFSPFGIGEDPATGSAAAALAGAIGKFEDLSPGEHAFRIEQGYEMGRPSIIELGLDIAGVSIASASIGGDAVIISEGVLRV
jgi:trans-2,3-dihydro-3-hydroxyanthranilate isomerase